MKRNDSVAEAFRDFPSSYFGDDANKAAANNLVNQATNNKNTHQRVIGWVKAFTNYIARTYPHISHASPQWGIPTSRLPAINLGKQKRGKQKNYSEDLCFHKPLSVKIHIHQPKNDSESFLNISLSRWLHADFSVWQTKDYCEELQNRGPKKCDPSQQPAQVVAGGAREDVQGITERAFEPIST